MFSSRLAWDSSPNPISESLRARRAAGLEILDLTESNPTRAGFVFSSAEILAAFADTRNLLYAPDPLGLPEARAAVAAHQGVDTDRVILASSTSESYSWLFKLLANPGDEVLVPRPSYPLFDFLAGLESVKTRHYPLSYHEGWWVRFDLLRPLITKRTRAILLVNPNNPTGSFIKDHELAQLTAIAQEHGLALISDEVFADYGFGPDPRRVTTIAGVEGVNTFCLGGLSKAALLPQMKLGWIVCGGPDRRLAIDRLELIADTYLSVGTPVQHAAPCLLATVHDIQRQVRSRTAANLALLGGRHLHLEGGWYATIQVPRTRTEEQWALTLIEEAGVLVQPGYFYDFEQEAYLVLSLLTEPAVFAEGLNRILSITYN